MNIVGVLFIIFVVLKLVGVIAWSWVWVFSPIWIMFLIYFGFYLLAAIVGGTYSRHKS